MAMQGNFFRSNEEALVLLKKITFEDITKEFGQLHGLSDKGLSSCREQLHGLSDKSLDSCQEQLLSVTSNEKFLSKLEFSPGVEQKHAPVEIDPIKVAVDDMEIKEEPFHEEDPLHEDQDSGIAKVKEEPSTEDDFQQSPALLNFRKPGGQEESFDDTRGSELNGKYQIVDRSKEGEMILPTTKEKRFSCGKCSYSTHVKSHMANHVMTHEAKTITCPFCPFKTQFRNRLNRHLPIHDSSEEKNHLLCGLCPYKTFHAERLNTHLKRHASTTWYSCSKCSFKTRYNHGLARHNLIHDRYKENPFSCPHCKCKTRNKEYLKRHLRTKHPNVSENNSSD